MLHCTGTQLHAEEVAMYSAESLARIERAEALEQEREEVALGLRYTRSRVKKYDRLKKKNYTKVHMTCFSAWSSFELSSLTQFIRCLF